MSIATGRPTRLHINSCIYIKLRVPILVLLSQNAQSYPLAAGLKGDNISYIDYIFRSNYAMEAVINCTVVEEDGCSNSDHLPVGCELLLDTGQSALSVDGSTDGDVTQSTHIRQKPNWTDPLFVANRKIEVRPGLRVLPRGQKGT